MIDLGELVGKVENFFYGVRNLNAANLGNDFRVTNGYDTGKKARFRAESFPHMYRIRDRYRITKDLIADYMRNGLEQAVDGANYLFRTKITNNIFRSKIKLVSKGVKMVIRIPKFTYLFGARVKGYLKRNMKWLNQMRAEAQGVNAAYA